MSVLHPDRIQWDTHSTRNNCCWRNQQEYGCSGLKYMRNIIHTRTGKSSFPRLKACKSLITVTSPSSVLSLSFLLFLSAWALHPQIWILSFRRTAELLSRKRLNHSETSLLLIVSNSEASSFLASNKYL